MKNKVKILSTVEMYLIRILAGLVLMPVVSQAETVQFSKELYVKKDCGDGESVVTGSINIPTDIPYRFKDYSVHIPTCNSTNNSYSVTQSPDHHSFIITLKAVRHSECWMFFGWHGPASWLGVQVTVNMIPNACDDPPPVPAEGSTVQEFVQGYQKTIAGLECQINAETKRREIIIKEFENKIKEKASQKKGNTQVQLASDRTILSEIKVLAEEYAQSVLRISAEYTQLIEGFSRTKEETSNQTNHELLSLANRAKYTDFSSISSMIQELIGISEREALYGTEFIFTAQKLLAQFNDADRTYREKMEAFGTFCQEKGLKKLDLISTAVASLSQLIRSSERRRIEYSKKINALIKTLQQRESALIEVVTQQKREIAIKERESSSPRAFERLKEEGQQILNRFLNWIGRK